jgi:hypothetical protein
MIDPFALVEVDEFTANVIPPIAGQPRTADSVSNALQALANFHLGIAYQARGDYCRARDCFRQTVVGLDGAQVAMDAVERVVARGPDGGAFDLLLADPPYALGDAEVAAMLAVARDKGWLAPEALAVVERSHRGPDFHWPEGYESLRGRRYGEAVLWYGRAPGLAAETPEISAR